MIRSNVDFVVMNYCNASRLNHAAVGIMPRLDYIPIQIILCNQTVLGHKLTRQRQISQIDYLFITKKTKNNEMKIQAYQTANTFPIKLRTDG